MDSFEYLMNAKFAKYFANNKAIFKESTEKGVFEAKMIDDITMEIPTTEDGKEITDINLMVYVNEADELSDTAVKIGQFYNSFTSVYDKDIDALKVLETVNERYTKYTSNDGMHGAECSEKYMYTLDFRKSEKKGSAYQVSFQIKPKNQKEYDAYLAELKKSDEEKKKEEEKTKKKTEEKKDTETEEEQQNKEEAPANTDAATNGTTSGTTSGKTPKKQEEAKKQAPSTNNNSDGTTLGQKNALAKAKLYLDSMPFSYEGLINQLQYEGYSADEASYAVAHCGANWNEQAAKKAQLYLKSMSLSKEGLINQLLYEKFTQEQAAYGAAAVGY